MEALIDYILQFGQLNPQQIALMQSKGVAISLKRDDYFSEADKIAWQIGFVTQGILRVLYYNNQEEEITRYFLKEHHFAMDLNSFNYQLPSSEYVQAVTNCELIVLSRQAVQELSQTIIGWDEILHKITTKALLEKVSRISPMLAEDAIRSGI